MTLVGLSFLTVLADALSAVFYSVLKPVLTDVLNIIIYAVTELITSALVELVLQGWVVLLKLVAFFEDIFNIFTGLSDIQVNNVSQGKGLLDYLFQLTVVQQAMLAITLVSFVLIFLVSILGIIRSMGDMALENKNPLSQVLRDSMKATLSVILIPTVCLCGLMLVSNVMLVIHNEFDMGASDDADVSDLIFITVASSHIKNSADLSDYSGGHAYEDVDAMMDDFYVSEFNYFLAFASAIFLCFIMFVTIIQSIMRIYMILVLYIVSPLVAVMMPLDGGRKFQDWKKMFITYTLSAFGPLISMKLYLMVMCSVFTGTTTIQFGSSGMLTSIIEVMLILGGAYAVYSSRNMLVTLMDPAAAGVLGASGMFLNMALSYVSGGVSNAIGSAGNKMGSSGSKKSSSSSSSASMMNQSKSQAFSGK